MSENDQNNEECGYDGKDCCESTCTGTPNRSSYSRYLDDYDIYWDGKSCITTHDPFYMDFFCEDPNVARRLSMKQDDGDRKLELANNPCSDGICCEEFEPFPCQRFLVNEEEDCNDVIGTEITCLSDVNIEVCPPQEVIPLPSKRHCFSCKSVHSDRCLAYQTRQDADDSNVDSTSCSPELQSSSSRCCLLSGSLIPEHCLGNSECSQWQPCRSEQVQCKKWYNTPSSCLDSNCDISKQLLNIVEAGAKGIIIIQALEGDDLEKNNPLNSGAIRRLVNESNLPLNIPIVVAKKELGELILNAIQENIITARFDDMRDYIYSETIVVEHSNISGINQGEGIFKKKKK